MWSLPESPGLGRIRLAQLIVCGIALSCATSARQPGGADPAATSGAARQEPESKLLMAGLDTGLSARIEAILIKSISERVTPGASIAVARHGQTALLNGYGYTDWNTATASPVDPNTVYDLASLTKVVATTTLAMQLEEQGKIRLDQTVNSYLPEFDSPEKMQITLRQLLTHRGGLEAFAALYATFRGREAYLKQINERPLTSKPGTQTVYSDWDMILLQLVIERVTGTPLDVLAEQMIFQPLGMKDTRFSPPNEWISRIAPTEIDPKRGGLVHGFVHDENAWAMGGVAGHAGLFSTARDLSVFAQMLLNGGEYNGIRILKPQTIARWTSRQDAESSRALGWDTPSNGSSAGRYFSPRSYGHTGFTGTSIWIDPEKNLFVILLTNRVNPTRDNPGIGSVRRDVADAVQEAVIGGRRVNWEERGRGERQKQKISQDEHKSRKLKGEF